MSGHFAELAPLLESDEAWCHPMARRLQSAEWWQSLERRAPPRESDTEVTGDNTCLVGEGVRYRAKDSLKGPPLDKRFTGA